MGSGQHGDSQVLPFSISAFWVSGAPVFDQRLHPAQASPLWAAPDRSGQVVRSPSFLVNDLSVRSIQRPLTWGISKQMMEAGCPLPASLAEGRR